MSQWRGQEANVLSARSALLCGRRLSLAHSSRLCRSMRCCWFAGTFSRIRRRQRRVRAHEAQTQFAAILRPDSSSLLRFSDDRSLFPALVPCSCSLLLAWACVWFVFISDLLVGQVTVVVDERGQLCQVHKAGGVPLSDQQIQTCIANAQVNNNSTHSISARIWTAGTATGDAVMNREELQLTDVLAGWLIVCDAGARAGSAAALQVSRPSAAAHLSSPPLSLFNIQSEIVRKCSAPSRLRSSHAQLRAGPQNSAHALPVHTDSEASLPCT